MSACGRTHLLDAVVAGEAPVALALELRAHAAQCPRCRHELNWLESEQQLFRQRAGRDEVSHLWKGVAQRSGLEAPRPWPRVFATLAATLVLAVGVGRLATQRTVTPAGVEPGDALQSEQLESAAAASDFRAACSTLPTGLGFHCGPAIPASFIASR
jgi:anti-sigma factor RsiW